MDRGISPPPTKRRKISGDKAIATEDTAVKSSEEADRPDQSPPKSPSKTIRIFSWNINGITPFIQKPITSFFETKAKTSTSASTTTTSAAQATSHTSTFPQGKPASASLRAFLRRHDWPHILLLQEVKIARTDTRTQRAVHAAVNAREGPHDHGPDYTVHFTLPTDPINVRAFGGKMYGVASVVRADFAAACLHRVRPVTWDAEGRVHVLETRDGKLAILNVYAVNGTDRPYRCPATGAVHGTRHDRKRAFHRLLLAEAQRLERDGWHLVLAGDFNVARARIDGFPNLRTWPPPHVLNRADFNAAFFENPDGLRAVDVWRAMRGDERRYTYYPRGRPFGSSCDRVDLVMVSRRLMEEGRVVVVDILNTPQERGPSDHVPIFVEIRDDDDE